MSVCSEENEKTKNVQTEIDATKKEAQKEMERNETLEQLKQRLIESVNRLEKQRECDLHRRNSFNESNHITYFQFHFQWHRKTKNTKNFGGKWMRHRH